MRRLRGLLAALCVSLASLIILAAWRIDRAGTLDTATPAAALVVLGARVNPDGEPSTTLRARVEHAATLYRRGLAPKLIFSGGVGDFGDSEAAVSRRLAVSLGVPEADCLLEEASHSTAQNAAFTTALLRAQSLHTIIVVTDPYHLPRALRLFEREGVKASGSPVVLAPRHRDPLLRAWWTLREVAAHARLSLARLLSGLASHRR
ncbi:MAG: YdcF family protein [Archangium sp.]|nr:YdcF family protein [Archangium sp.]